MSKWNEVSRIERLPACSGVYVIYRYFEPVYVGSAVNLHDRLYCHAGYANSPVGLLLNELGRHLRIKFRVSTKYGDWAMIELRMIRKLKPRLNVQHKNPRPQRMEVKRRGEYRVREYGVTFP